MNFLSLFSGVGMTDLALEKLGHRTAAFVEIDDYAHAVMAKRFPHAKGHRDVREVNAGTFAGLEIKGMAGGFPCQDISNAGARAGITGARSSLWGEFFRLIDELRPEIVFIENVAALLGRGLDVVLRDLAAIGYSCEWDCIPAAAVGAPHLRDRFWGVAYPADAAAWQRGVFNVGKGSPTINLSDPPKKLPRAGFMAHGLVRAQAPVAPRKTKRLNPGSAWVGECLSVDHGWWHEKVERGLWPTPEASDGSGGRVSSELGGRRPSGAKRSVTLATAVDHAARGLWPTPRFSGGHSSGGGELSTYKRTPSQAAGKHGLYLQAEVCEAEASAGRPRGALNADWVEWLMGIPIGWTNLNVIDPFEADTWNKEPIFVPRVCEAQPKRKERLSCIGNALVPQVFEWVASRALAFEQREEVAA